MRRSGSLSWRLKPFIQTMETAFSTAILTTMPRKKFQIILEKFLKKIKFFVDIPSSWSYNKGS